MKPTNNKQEDCIKITRGIDVIIPKIGNVLMIGELDGFLGIKDELCTNGYGSTTLLANYDTIYESIEKGCKIRIIGKKNIVEYFISKLQYLIDIYHIDVDRLKKNEQFGCLKFEDFEESYYKNKYGIKKMSKSIYNKYHKNLNGDDKRDIWNNMLNFYYTKNMRFDSIIINPPYDGNLHLEHFEKALNLLKDDGKMVIIEPATWLINIRNNELGKKVQNYKQIQNIKSRIEGHVESVVIENLNKEFGTGLYVPFSITTIDMSKTFETIEFVCFGEHKTVESIYDCNLIGDYETIHSIITKVSKFGNFMKNHTTKNNMGDGFCYTKYGELTPVCGCSYVARTDKGVKYDSDSMWSDTGNGSFTYGYITSAYHSYNNEISETPLYGYDCGRNITDKIADNIYGTREELENWKHFIFNNKLPLFLNIVLTIDQHNNSKDYLPWLVDRQYTDEEINEMFGFTDDEIKLIDYTIKKYERNSIWFKRYMCGKESITDEDVMSDIERIRNEVENEHKTQSNVE